MAAAQTCDLAAPADQPFEVPIAAEGVRVVLEVWIDGADPAWVDQTLATLHERGVPATVVVSPGPVPESLQAPLAKVKESDVLSLAFVLPAESVPQTLTAPLQDLRRSLKPATRLAGRSQTVIAPLGSRAGEAMLGRLGFHALIALEPSPQAGPRYAGILEGMQRINVVFPSGPYQGPCGPDPRVGPFTPKAADRAARAVQQASGVPGAPVVRVAMLGAKGLPTDGEVAARWVAEVIRPGGAQVVTIRDARISALRALQKGVDMSAAVGAVGRVVSLEDASAAADALAEVSVLPRGLPGDLTLSEAFYAFTLVVAGRDDGTAVRIKSLKGPSSAARSALSGPTAVAASDLESTAKALLAAMPEELPAAMPVGGTLLTTAELLTALASAVRGEEPPIARPVAVPDPNARGLGWGDSAI